MNEELFQQYARFAVRAAVNVQPGQVFIIGCPIECAWFARLCAAEGFLAGARDVVVHYNDEKLSRIRMEGASAEALQDVKPWLLSSYMDYYEGEGSVCRLAIYAQDPEIYKGLDTEKVEGATRARSRALKPWMELSMASRMQWCVLSVPTKAWAQKVFPALSAQDAEQALWQAILKASRIGGGEDPVAVWKRHADLAAQRAERLNTANLDALHLKGENGTDLTVGLCDDYQFEGIENQRTDGLPFLANVPSEEIFTAPHARRVDGIVKSSMPYVYNGNLIEGITARFEKGVAVQVSAEKGDDLLRQMLGADEGARRLGEVALVPASSPIRQSGLLFYNTLFDENAACHIAFGAGYPTTVKNGSGLSSEQLAEKGLNDSLIHEDIMIGTPDMDIDGILKDGSRLPVFRSGEWAL